MRTIKFLNNFIAFFLVFMLLFTVACHKPAKDLPTLSIAAPLADDQFTNGQVITIKGDAVDAVRLHALSIKITDDKRVLFCTQMSLMCMI